MGNDLISVLVPAYNVEDYLEQCLSSIINQTYKNIEVIITDDGSTDRTGAIADEYAAKDSRLRVLHGPNKGIASARNLLLSEAKGDFICFVDSDDYVHPDLCRELMELLKENSADMSICKNHTVKDGLVIKAEAGSKVTRLSTNDAFERSFMKDGDTGTLWGKIYRKELFNGISFPDKRVNEDDAVMHRIIARCSLILHTEKRLYFYRKRGSSITNSDFSVRELDYLEAISDKAEFFRQNGPGSVYERTLAFYCIVLVKFYARVSVNKVENKKAVLKKLFSDFKKNAPYVIKSRNSKLKQKIVYILFLIYPGISVFLMKMLDRLEGK